MMMAVAGRTFRGSYAAVRRCGNPSAVVTPKACRGPRERGPRLQVGGVRHRGAGWEAIRSRLGLTYPRHEETEPTPSCMPPHYRSRSVVT
jgi:hypothetical protein